MAEPTACEKQWAETLASFQRNLDDLKGKHPESSEDIKLPHAGVLTIGKLIKSSPRVNANGAASKGILARAEAERAVLCKYLEGKALFTSMILLYAAAHAELRSSLKTEEGETSEGLRDQRRRKRNSTGEHPAAPKKMVPTSNSIITTRNFYAPLRTATMETDSGDSEDNTQEEAVPVKTGRPPPIILTSAVNLIQL
jgi:hypothetical protein